MTSPKSAFVKMLKENYGYDTTFQLSGDSLLSSRSPDLCSKEMTWAFNTHEDVRNEFEVVGRMAYLDKCILSFLEVSKLAEMNTVEANLPFEFDEAILIIRSQDIKHIDGLEEKIKSFENSNGGEFVFHKDRFTNKASINNIKKWSLQERELTLIKFTGECDNYNLTEAPRADGSAKRPRVGGEEGEGEAKLSEAKRPRVGGEEGEGEAKRFPINITIIVNSTL